MGLSLSRIEKLGCDLPQQLRDYRQRVAERFAAYVREELKKQHTSGRSLYDERYPKPKSGGTPMFDTGELMEAYVVRTTGSGSRLVVDNTSPHTIVDHDGKHTHLPDERGMPERWRRELDKIKAQEAKKLKF